jgi:hypothetical protein
MKYYKNGFYDLGVHGANIPADAVSITEKQYHELLAAQSQGKRIVSGDDGFPIAVDPEPDRAALLEIARAKIDSQTDERILNGFEHAGHRFYLSLENQMNYKAECDLRHSLTYPVIIKTASGYAPISSPAEYLEFYTAAYRFIRETVGAGWIKKDTLQTMSIDELQGVING